MKTWRKIMLISNNIQVKSHSSRLSHSQTSYCNCESSLWTHHYIMKDRNEAIAMNKGRVKRDSWSVFSAEMHLYLWFKMISWLCMRGLLLSQEESKMMKRLANFLLRVAEWELVIQKKMLLHILNNRRYLPLTPLTLCWNQWSLKKENGAKWLPTSALGYII